MRQFSLAFVLTVVTCGVASAQTAAPLDRATELKIADIANKVLHDTAVPSASIGIVQNGRIVYTGAFGLASLKPEVAAEPKIAYPIGSISKQFTATAMLLLQEEGKLSLSDPVSRFFPELTRSSDVKLINLLTHTSGYQDYAPQDYTIPAWKLPGDPLKVVREFAGKPLDFEPGTQWQYSNTNFVLAALIVQKASRMPFADFLRQRVLVPARLEGVLNLNTDQARLKVTGYMRNALAPIRPAAMEAPGWYFGDGDLAMPAASLLTWDLTILNQSLLTPASYKLMETPFLLRDGTDSHYGLGISVFTRNGRLVFEHSGEVGGFVAENVVFPATRSAIVVLTNQEASNAASQIAHGIDTLIFPPSPSAASPANNFAPTLQTILAGLQAGRIDRSLFTANCNAYFDKAALEDFASSLAPLGTITSATQSSTELRGGMTFAAYIVAFSGGTAVQVTVYLQPDGKIEQLLVTGKA